MKLINSVQRFSIGWLTCLLTMAILESGCGESSTSKIIDFDSDPNKLIVIGEGHISTGFYERDFAIAPDESEICFTRRSPGNRASVILCMTKAGERWNDPEVATFSGQYTDLEPFFHPNGGMLYFVSNRPVHPDSLKEDFDIWAVSRGNGVWKNPTNIGAPVNTSANEFYPSVSRNGHLYFTASYADAKGLEDIYMSEYIDGQYTQPVSLDSAINSETYEFNAFIDPDEKFLIFSSYGREDGIGGGDLYVSRKSDDGFWLSASNLGEPVNSPFLDYSPMIYKSHLIFTSERDSIESMGIFQSAEAYQRFLGSPGNGNGDIYAIPFN